MKQALIALDQLLNSLCVFLPGGAWADETFSARCWRMRARQPFTWLRRLVDGLFFWQTEHCRRSYEAERARAHLPPEERI